MVAGCSFSATANTADGTSWSELLADRLGWDLVNLARQGCSNGGIRIQIDEIRRQRPDFAIVTPTFWDRMEIPAFAAPYDWDQGPSTGWNPPLEQHLQNRERRNGYRREDGINNVNYGTNPYRMICETIFTLAENYPHPYRSGRITKPVQTAIRHYIDGIYDTHWKKQMDEWIMIEGALQLYFDQIPFLLQPVLLWPFDPAKPDLWRNVLPRAVPDHFVMQDPSESVLSVCGNHPFQGEDPGYHSSPEGQKAIADNWYRRITQDHKVC